MSKLKYEDIAKEVSERGWTLISDTYQNLKTPMCFECPNRHQKIQTLAEWRKKCYCLDCEEQERAKAEKEFQANRGIVTFSVDQATNTSGWAVYNNKALVDYGHYTSTGTESVEKIADTKRWFAEMISKWKPNRVSLEDIQLQQSESSQISNVLLYKKLAHLQGVLQNYCYENNIETEIIPPSVWRSYIGITGKRNELKKKAQDYILQTYDKKVTQDEADAILIGRYSTSGRNPNRMIVF